MPPNNEAVADQGKRGGLASKVRTACRVIGIMRTACRVDSRHHAHCMPGR